KVLLARSGAEDIHYDVKDLQVGGSQAEYVLLQHGGLGLRQLGGVSYDRSNLMPSVERFLHNQAACFTRCTDNSNFHIQFLLKFNYVQKGLISWDSTLTG